jgi:hypothetical protein
MSISARLKEFKKGPSPSKTHAGEIRKARERFIGMHRKLNNAGKGLAMDIPYSEYNGDLRALIRFQAEEVLPWGKSMREEKGIYSLFYPVENSFLSGDIMHSAPIGGCPVFFIANSDIFHGDAPEPGVRPDLYPGLRGIYIHPSLLFDEHICVFVDAVEAHMGKMSGLGFPMLTLPLVLPRLIQEYGEDIPLLNGGFPPETRIFYENLSELSVFFMALSTACALRKGKEPLFNAMVHGVLLHELAHMLLSRKDKPNFTNLQEFFGTALLVSEGVEPHISLAELMGVYSNERETSHSIAIGVFLEYLNLFFDEEGRTPGAFFSAALKYPAASPAFLRGAGSKILEGICKELSIRWDDFCKGAVRQAKEIVFG